MRDDENGIKIFTLEQKHLALLPLIEDTFKEQQINYRLRSRYDLAYDGLFVGQKGLSDIYVFEKDKEKALDILNDILKENLENL